MHYILPEISATRLPRQAPFISKIVSAILALDLRHSVKRVCQLALYHRAPRFVDRVGLGIAPYRTFYRSYFPKIMDELYKVAAGGAH